ncbi:MAG TPA: hypothetical protein VFW38_06845 [Solirubrobacteraceae bacterium]|nr:hypothetical protein [Solirubrobacteraceae bacterium]
MIGSDRRTAVRARFLIGLWVALVAFGVAMATAGAATAADSPIWKIASYTMPGNLPPAGKGEVHVVAVNVGGANTNGSAITVEDHLPTGLTASAITGYDVYGNLPDGLVFPAVLIQNPAAKMVCKTTPQPVCTTSDVLPTGDQLVMRVTVKVAEGAEPHLTNKASVSGGGVAEAASIENPVTVSNATTTPGLAPGSVMYATSTSEAGGHASVTSGFALNTVRPYVTAGGPRDIAFDLPPGAVGNTVGMPRCTVVLIAQENCPVNTIVGLAALEFAVGPSALQVVAPVFNIAPSPGEPAAFGFVFAGYVTRLDTSVLSNGNYGVKVISSDLEQTSAIYGTYITFWGVPADHQGPGPLTITAGDVNAKLGSIGGPSSTQRVPLLTNPTQCSQPLTTVAEMDAWRSPGVFRRTEVPAGSMTGCLEVPFGSEFSFLPDTVEAGAPAGYEFSLRVPQVNTASTRATSNVRDVSLTLPEGVVVNPSAAWGLRACDERAFYGPAHPSQAPAEVAKCPRESQVGKVWVKTPALEEALEGQVFLAQPECDPCSPQDAEDGKMVKLYVQAVSAGEGGIVIKLQGHADIDQATGRITTYFEENPQLPFERFKLKLAGGPRSVLANPRSCGVVRTRADLQPWSILEAPGEAKLVGDSTPSFEFEIDQNCHSPQFHPSFKAGMPNVEAGEYGEFTLAFGRSDNDEMLKSISIHTPAGLMGSLVGVALCKEADANMGTCPEASLLGSAEALTGPGANPFLVSGGRVYLTEGYGGAPFGLSIVVPAVAGPYTLSGTTGTGTVVVRSQIFVDSHTAQLTVTSGEIPHMLDGIPLQLKAVNVRIDRPHFMFNPTSCEKMAVTGTLTAVEGLSANVESPFQVTNCSRMAFKPGFRSSTSAKTSRADGASLKVQLTYPDAPAGTQANIKTVRVELPKALPSRLSTLNHACVDAVFEQNPAACPAQSRVGLAKAITPLLPVAVEGPAYFVSHGGQKFPELVMVLQGYGVTIVLNGETFISEAGVTSSTFKTVPDVPVSKFELNLPEGPFSALAANTNLCQANLTMPTVFTGQNGAALQQSTPIEVEGCPYALSVVRHKTHAGTATVTVAVPQAGRLVAGGKGLTGAAKIAKARGKITLSLKKRHAGTLHTKILLRFTPNTGKQRTILKKTITITIH